MFRNLKETLSIFTIFLYTVYVFLFMSSSSKAVARQHIALGSSIQI